MGFEKRDLLTAEAEQVWRRRLEEEVPEERMGELRYREKMRELARLATDPERASETVNTLAIDHRGDIACAVSTSGWAWKYPGRLGDSPIIGAGGYADNRYGAAACTGRGEMAICLSTARSVVLYMKLGMRVEEACVEAMSDFTALQDPYAGGISIRAIDSEGHPAGASNRENRFLWHWHDGMGEPAKAPLAFVDTGH
jgi:beta-aspartyl-peptidase (threonine type)